MMNQTVVAPPEMDKKPGCGTMSGLSLENIESLIAKTPFAQLLGARIERYAKGEVELSVLTDRRLVQHHGFIHGAVVSFVADSACAWAAASVAGDVVTAEYKINLLAPAVGSRLIGRGHVIEASPRQVVCRADVFIERAGIERLVATALGTVAPLAWRSLRPGRQGATENERS